MSSFRKLTKKYTFFKKKSRRNTLLKGTFIPLDVVRLSKNSFHKSKDIKSNLTIQEKPSHIVIAETDSEPDDVDFVEEKNQVNSDNKSTLSKDNKDVNESKEKPSLCKKENSSTDKNLHPNISEDPEIRSKIESSMKHFKYQTTSKEKEVMHAEQLARLAIKTRHPILPQHGVESTAGTRALTSIEITSFLEYAPLKQGNFDNPEDERIKENWKTFCEDNQWDPKNPKPFLFMKHKNKEFLMFDLENRKRFVQCLAHGLPNRSLYNVFHRFKILFDPHKTERYTEEEDKTILQFMAAYQSKMRPVVDNDRPYADLAAILNRTRDSVWRRYNCVLKKNPDKTN